MKKIEFIGREAEQKILENAYQSNEAEMVAVIGRRRVGKTFLIKTAYKGLIDFEATGLQKGADSEQLKNFSDQLNDAFYKGKSVLNPQNWLDAFRQLSLELDKKKKKKDKRMV